MDSPTISLRRTAVRLLSLLPAGALLTVMLAAGCEDTVVPAVGQARLGGQLEGGRGAKNDECFLAVLYRVEGELFYFEGGGAMTIDPQHASGGFGGGGTGGGGDPSSSKPGITQELHGHDGYVRLHWDGEVVAEFTIDRAFLESGRVEVLAYQVPNGARFEYHLYTQPACDEPWGSFGEGLTRQEVDALED